MANLLSLLALPFVIVVGFTACSGGDPGSPIATAQHGRGSGGTGGATGGGDGGGGNGTNGNGAGGGGGGAASDYDAGPTPGGADYDAAAPRPSSDAGTQSDTGTPAPNAPLGSCGNPRCGTFGQGGDCGCTARDSNGNQVQLGCNGAQGVCACFTNGQQSTQVVDAPNACDTNAATMAEFMSECGCQ